MNKAPVAELADGQLGLPSLGAKFHPEECIPCKFLVSRNGCKDGENCIYCHAPHPELNQGQRRRLMSRINRKKRQDGMFIDQLPQSDKTHDQISTAISFDVSPQEDVWESNSCEFHNYNRSTDQTSSYHQ